MTTGLSPRSTAKRRILIVTAADLPGRRPDGVPLIVRLRNWVGEVVLSLPALRRLSASGYSLRLVGKGWAASLFEGERWPVEVAPKSLVQSVSKLRALRASLAHESATFAADSRALLVTTSFSSALEARFAGLRPAGYSADARSILLQPAYALPEFVHVAHAYWHLAGRFLGRDEPFPREVSALQTSAVQRSRAAQLLAAQGLGGRPYVVLCPFSGPADRTMSKVWPGFVELERLVRADGMATVVCPGPGEEAQAQKLFPAAKQLVALPLGEYGVVLNGARGVVANDTGPGHLAAAVGARLISIYGPASRAHWAPLGAHVRLLFSDAGWPQPTEVCGILRDAEAA